VKTTTSNSVLKDNGNKVLYRQVTDEILNDIRCGKLALGTKLPSQAELVQKYNVSVNTVRLSLASLEKQGIIRKEQGRGSFISLQSGTSQQRSQQLKTMGLIFERTAYPDDRDSQSQVMLAFSDECRKHGIRLLIAETDFDAHLGGAKLIETFRNVTIDGLCVFLHEPEGAAERIAVLGREFEAAVVFFYGPTYDRQMPIDTVDVASYAGTEQLMEYLIALGHRRIGYVGIEVDYSDQFIRNMRRFATYKNSLIKAGIPLNKEYILAYPYGQELSNETLEQILGMVRRPDPVTAIFACSDWLAWHITHYFWEKGIRVPQEVSVAGFDGADIAVASIPTLTTVACPYTSVVQTVMDLLTKRLADPERPIQKISVPSKLIVRESVISVNDMNNRSPDLR
jgi:DNA-binding LacI/PurR family transcriptional regulator